MTPAKASLQVPPIVELLREATSGMHQELERASPFLRKDFSRSDYLCWLRQMQGFYAGFDPLAQQCAALTRMGWDYKPRSGLIADDLCYLGQSTEHAVPAVQDVLAFLEPQDAMQMAGALYVVEGSALGGHILVKVVGRSLGEEGAQGKSSLLPHGADPYPAWGRFMRLLGQTVQGPQASERVVQGACATFRHLLAH